MLITFFCASLLLISCLTNQVQAYHTSLARRGEKGCVNIKYEFNKKQSLDDWIPISGATPTYEFDSDGIKMKLLEPEGNKRLNVAEGDRTLPVNSKEGSGFTFNHTNTMLYGEFTVDLKSAEAPGAVTAIILYANNGDEIDFEILAGAKDQVTTNYFYGQNITYGVNGETTDVEGKQAYAKFHKYTIKWTPEKIIWSIDGAVVRQKLKSSTVLDPKHGNINQYPGSLAYISIGLWDGSTSPGTAEWSQGPIDWKKYPGAITAHVRSVEVICDPKHN